jgi:hypothetical protein
VNKLWKYYRHCCLSIWSFQHLQFE